MFGDFEAVLPLLLPLDRDRPPLRDLNLEWRLEYDDDRDCDLE